MTKVVKNPATAPGIKYGGRKKGTPNKSSLTVAELCEKHGLNVIEEMIYFAKGDYEALKYPEYLEKQGFGGMPIKDLTISPEQRYKANMDLAKFIYPTRKAVEFKNENPGDRQIVLSYSEESLKKAAQSDEQV